MAHWTDQYIGVPYDSRTNHCAAFVVMVAQSQFNHKFELPTHDLPSGQSARAAMLQQEWFKVAMPNNGEPQDGDLVLMNRGDLWHCGIVAVLDGVPYALHCLRSAASVLTRLSRVGELGFNLEGVYRWK